MKYRKLFIFIITTAMITSAMPFFAFAETTQPDAEVLLVAEVPVSYSITVPEEIVLCGDEGIGEKQAKVPISIQGEIPNTRIIDMTISGTPLKRDDGKVEKEMNFTKQNFFWTRNELKGNGVNAEIGVSAMLTPGTWNGTITFSCSMDRSTTFEKRLGEDPFSIIDESIPCEAYSFSAYDTSVITIDDKGITTPKGVGRTQLTISYISDGEVVKTTDCTIIINLLPAVQMTDLSNPLYNNKIEEISFGYYQIPDGAKVYDVSDDNSGFTVAFVEGTNMYVTNTVNMPVRFGAGAGATFSENGYGWAAKDRLKKVHYDFVDTSAVTSLYNMFSGMDKLEEITGLENFDVSNVTSMERMFISDYSLTKVSGVSNWNTKSVSNLTDMFYRCYALIDVTELTDWDVSNVTSMECMFYECKQLTDISYLSKWKLQPDVNMDGILRYCPASNPFEH